MFNQQFSDKIVHELLVVNRIDFTMIQSAKVESAFHGIKLQGTAVNFGSLTAGPLLAHS